MEKTKPVYGVEMTSLEEMRFAKYIANDGIAMNTKTKEERYLIAKEWFCRLRSKSNCSTN